MMTIEKSEKIAPPPIRDRAWHVEWQLENWARMMGGGGRPDALPDKAHAGQNFTSYDSESAYDALDLRLALTVNAVISGLSPAEQSALHHQYLAAVYRFNRGQFGAALMMAKLKLASGLVAKGVWLG